MKLKTEQMNTPKSRQDKKDLRIIPRMYQERQKSQKYKVEVKRQGDSMGRHISKRISRRKL